MKFKTLSVVALLVLSSAAMAWTGPFNNGWGNNGWGNNGNFMGDGNFGFNMSANARGNGNGWGNNGYNNGYNNGWGNNGNFMGDGNFGFNMGGSARGNGNGWGNGYNGYNPYYAPAYGAAPYGAPHGRQPMNQDQIKAQQEATAKYYKKMEEQRKAFEAAQKVAYEEYVASMQKR